MQPPTATTLLQQALTLNASGRESAAIPLYRRAISSGLSQQNLHTALLSLASSLHTTHQILPAIRTLKKPENSSPATPPSPSSLPSPTMPTTNPNSQSANSPTPSSTNPKTPTSSPSKKPSNANTTPSADTNHKLIVPL
jgi:Tetratrico peptide repeat